MRNPTCRILPPLQTGWFAPATTSLSGTWGLLLHARLELILWGGILDGGDKRFHGEKRGGCRPLRIRREGLPREPKARTKRGLDFALGAGGGRGDLRRFFR